MIPTRERVYSENWNRDTVFVTKLVEDYLYEEINEISESEEINTMLNLLRNAAWEENTSADITGPHYCFTWNSYNHMVWVNKETNQLLLMIDKERNYVLLSEESSIILYKILTKDDFEEKKSSY